MYVCVYKESREKERKSKRGTDKGKITVNTYFHEQIWRHNETHDKWTQSIYWQRYDDEGGGWWGVLVDNEWQRMVTKRIDLSI